MFISAKKNKITHPLLRKKKNDKSIPQKQINTFRSVNYLSKNQSNSGAIPINIFPEIIP